MSHRKRFINKENKFGMLHIDGQIKSTAGQVETGETRFF